MQHLNTLWQVVSAAQQVAELARSVQTYRFTVQKVVTFYMHVASAEVRVVRWTHAYIEVEAALQAPFGWRIATDQDEAGVYFVARRRPVVGGLAGATFTVGVPAPTHVILKLDEAQLRLDQVSGTIELPPPRAEGEIELWQQSF